MRLRNHKGRRLVGARRAVVALLLTLVGLCATNTPMAYAATGQTIVSLTFDDGSASEYWTLGQLEQYNMQATFYINSARVGTSSYYMTWSQIHDLYNAGNEIAGHTADHVNLPQTDPVEAKRQICDDRDNLINQGFRPTDFAYPYGAYNASIEQMVAACGYNSARTTVPGVETVPPPDPYALHQDAQSSNLSDYENAVLNAEKSPGGSVNLVFHQICNACDVNWVTQSDFTSLLAWLQGQASNGVVVERVQDVIGGALQPAVAGPSAPPAPNGWNVLRNASLEYNSTIGGAPDCFSFDFFGNNNATWSITSDAHTGSHAERVDVSNYVSGDAKLLPTEDLGRCSPSATPGHQYVISEWYKSTVPVAFTVFSRDSLGAFTFWKSSPTFAATSTWKQAVWTTPTVPGGDTGLSFGLTISSNGSLTVDDFGFQDAAPTGSPDTTAPSVSITSPATGTTVAGTSSITANASDNVAVEHLDYLIDGAVVGSETDGFNTYAWFTRNLANGAHTIAIRAVDPSGNATTTSAITVFVSNSPTNLLQNPSLETASGSTPRCWLFGGSGTNAATWTRTTDAHTGSFAENVNVTSYTSGDRKLVSAQDSGTCAPAATVGHSYTVSGWYKVPSGTGGPKFFAYYRSSAGSWVFWAQSSSFVNSSAWKQISWSTPAVPSGATNLSVGMGLTSVGSLTMDDFALYDNSPPPDTTPPTSAIMCNGASDGGGCASGWYGAPVSVTLTASDNLGGSGIAAIRYTTDGSDPSPTNGNTYTGAFTVTSTTTIKFRAYDNAGNAEAIHTQLVQIDTTPPASTISCDLAACQSGWYNTPVSVSLAAMDSGGAGVAFMRYTTDGTDPTTTNGEDYLGAFSVSSTTTIKYRAYDNAGNAEPVNLQTAQVDATAPSSTIVCNGGACGSSWYTAPVSVNLAATDSGSGVAAIYYTTDGSIPAQSAADLYAGPFAVSATTTVTYFSVDNAGNVEAVDSQLVQVDSTPAVSSISCNGSACSSGWYNGSVSVTLSAADNAGGSGVASIVYTTDGSDPSPANGSVYSGAFSVASTTTVTFRAYDTAGNAEAVNAQTIQIDAKPPTTTISCNGSPCSTSAYPGNVSVTLSASDNGGGAGIAGIYYTTDGTTPTQTTADLYVGPFSLTATARVRYFAVDNAGNVESLNSQLINVTASGVTITSPAAGATVSGTTSLGASVSGITVDHVEFFVDGNPVGTVTTSPYVLAWDSATVIDGTHSIVAAAFDASGAETDSGPVSITVSNNSGDTTPPTSTIACNNAACFAWYTGSVSVSLRATDDPGGSGVASIVYTTDGTDPSLTNGLAYNGRFSVAATTTVKYRAYDYAGNAESVNTQVVGVDTVAPTSSMSCNGTGCASSFYATSVSVSLAATDNTGGSGVTSIVYTTDGSTPSTTNGTTYTGPFAVAATTTVNYRAYDTAGNAEPVNSALIQVDTTSPTSTIACNAGACAAWYKSSVSVSLSATDNSGGSGVASIRYTTDGSTPSLNNGSVYGGPFSVAATTTVKYRAYDNAGNAEPVNTQIVGIDTTAPTASISCNGTGCASSFYASSVSVGLSATDNSGGSGVASIVYTTDGSTPSTTNGTTYTGSLVVATTTTIKYRAYDNTGNATSVNSALIQVDTAPPTSAIACNSGTCAGWVKPGVSVSLSATDNTGGSGVASIRYTTDGSTPSLTNGTKYSTAFSLNATTTVKYRAYDNVGNAEPANTQAVQVDGTAPSVSLTAPSPGLVAGTVSLSANASDNVSIDHVDFLVDGTVVGTVTAAPYTYAWQSATVADGSHTITARAVDPAGNATTSASVAVTVTNNNLLQNSSLETASGSTPTCWLFGGSGTNSATWTRTSDAHTGSYAENVNISSYTSGDRKLVNTQDSGACAPAANVGHTYTVTAWYKVPSGTATPVVYAYYRNSSGTWVYWTQSSPFATSSSWTRATWTTPAVPTGGTNLSVGLGIPMAGSLTIDDLGLFATG